MVTVQDFDTSRFANVASRHNARAFCGDRQTLWSFDFHADGNAFEVQNDVSDVFTHTSNTGEFVQDVVDLNRCDGRALQARHQNATKRVAHCETKAAL